MKFQEFGVAEYISASCEISLLSNKINQILEFLSFISMLRDMMKQDIVKWFDDIEIMFIDVISLFIVFIVPISLFYRVYCSD